MTGNTMTNKKSMSFFHLRFLITPLISSNFSCCSLYCLSCDIPFWLPFWYLDIKGVIRTVNHMTGNTITKKKSLKISKG
jgi:hypothetical protein